MKRPGHVPGRGPTQVPRTARVGELVKSVVSELLATGKIKDPRVQGRLVTVTRVVVAGDLGVATVGVVVHGERGEEVLAGLRSAAGLFRRAVGAELKARVTPELRFRLDEGHDAESRIEEILRQDRPPAPAVKPEADDDEADDEA